MTYAAYLRVYEPVSAFHEPDRSRWAAYAASATRPRRRDALTAEHAEAMRRVVSAPYVVLPERESEHAYVRRADGTTYICPWQTRLRCLLGYGRMVSSASPLLPGTIPPGDDDQAVAHALAGLDLEGPPPRHRDPSARLHIVGSVWRVPLAWFVLFAAAERWLSLGPGPALPSAAATASATRALVYTTPVVRARRRVGRALAAFRDLPPGFEGTVLDPPQAAGDLAEVGRWLAEFHPYSLVELDYGGLVYLVSDDMLCGDQSVAEIRAAIDGAASGECELAMAMYMRAHTRWRAFADFEQAN
ncbi:MAG TPA: hypothetical protein VFQ68_05300 [Streptosporangiaceae bacterium]|nr:hypothetical protein [Streptosporangiaceae bacterium]